jgi:ubiquinone/menaquinone biosynthesis C-methylase UbiE
MNRDEARVVDGNLAHFDSEWSVSHYGDQLQGLFPTEARLIEAFFPPPPASVLDLGCGAARTTVALAARGYATIGIDLSAPLLQHARRRHPDLDLRLMDATALTFPDATFSAAIFSYNGIDGVYPVQARERCLAEVFRVLQPGGVFLLSSHNAVGALFSGGYLYLRGYLNAMKWLARQVTNGVWREWYWRYDDPGGAQYLYSAPPSYTVAQASGAGFAVVEIRGATGERDPGRIARREQHVHFVLRRPR